MPGPPDPLADPGAAAATGVDRLALVGHPGAGAPVGVQHHVGHARRRQHGVVAPGREVDLPGRPAEAGGERVRHRVRVDVGEVSRRATDPGAGRQVGGLAGAAVVPGRLHVAQPQPGRGAEVRRGDLVVHEAVEDALLGLCPLELLTERLREGVVHLDRGRRGCVVPVGCGVAGDQVVAVLGRLRASYGGVGGLDQRGHLLGRRGRAAHRRGRAVAERDHGDPDVMADAVGGERVVGPAQVGVGLVLHDHDALGRRAGLQGVVDEMLRAAHAVTSSSPRASTGSPEPPSSAVFSTLTPRNSADGQPWLTAAT